MAKNEVAKKVETQKPAKQKKSPKEVFQRAKKFFVEVVSELKKVTWPTRKDLISHSIAVAIFIVVFAVLCGGVDWIFNALMSLIIA